MNDRVYIYTYIQTESILELSPGAKPSHKCDARRNAQSGLQRVSSTRDSFKRFSFWVNQIGAAGRRSGQDGGQTFPRTGSPKITHTKHCICTLTSTDLSRNSRKANQFATGVRNHARLNYINVTRFLKLRRPQNL